MKISFLVTYYNQEAYVRQSMDSILAAEKPAEWEILCGDDGSSDGTKAVISEYVAKDPEHIRMFEMPREEGTRYDSVRRASANRLNLLEHCSGECFCTLDGDDFYTDTAFATEAVGIFEKYPEVTLAAFGYREYQDGEFGGFRGVSFSAGGILEKRKYLRDGYIHAGACVHRIGWGRERMAYLKELGYFDDNNIVLNTLNFGEAYYTARPVYAYRQTGVSVFTSMACVEKSMLNVQGMDVDLKLMDPKWRKDLMSRYANPLITVWVFRKKLRETLGEEKYRKYLDGCRNIGDSIGETLLTWNEQGPDRKKEVSRMIRAVAADNPLRAVSACLNTVCRGGTK